MASCNGLTDRYTSFGLQAFSLMIGPRARRRAISKDEHNSLG